MYAAAKLLYHTMLWIMGDVVNADQFESVTIYSTDAMSTVTLTISLFLSHSLPFTLSLAVILVRCCVFGCHPYLLYNMWVRKQCLQMVRMITPMDKVHIFYYYTQTSLWMLLYCQSLS